MSMQLKKLFDDFGLRLFFEALTTRRAKICEIKNDEINAIFHTYYTKASNVNFSFLRDFEGPKRFHFERFLLPEFFNKIQVFIITLDHVPRDYDLILSGMLMSPSSDNFLLILTTDKLHKSWHEKIIKLTGNAPCLALTKGSIIQFIKELDSKSCAEVIDGA